MERFEGLSEVAGRLRSGELGIESYLDMLRERIEGRDGVVRALLPEESPDGRFGRLAREAEELLARWPSPQDRPPLFGVPVGIKDIFHVDGFTTRAGSTLPPEILAGPEAVAVALLKGAGALVLGKTATTEFAYAAPAATTNPRNPAHTPGGSSSGSAAAVAAGFCPLALGTQTIGSIIRPAAFCGVIGYKPTIGRVSLAGVIPCSSSADQAGWFCRDLEGIKLAASVLYPGWHPVPPPARPVLGIPEGPYLERASEAGLASFWRTVDRIRDAGFRVVSIPVMSNFTAVAARHSDLIAHEMARVHAAWYPAHKELYDPRTADLIKRGLAVDEDRAEVCREAMLDFRSELTTAMNMRSLAAWLAPAACGPAPAGLGSTGDPVMNLPWTHAGLPSVTLPSDLDQEGLPLGVQIVGRYLIDEQLLSLAGVLRDQAGIGLAGA